MVVGILTEGPRVAIYAQTDDVGVLAFDRDVVAGWDGWQPVAVVELPKGAALELRDFEIGDDGERLPLPVGFQYHVVNFGESSWTARQLAADAAGDAVRWLYAAFRLRRC